MTITFLFTQQTTDKFVIRLYAVLTAYTCKGLENAGGKENKDPLCSVPRLH